MKFSKWLDTFLSEKGIDLEQVVLADGPSGENRIPVGCIVDMMKQAPRKERDAIKTALIKIDFNNGDVLDFFQHLAPAIAL